jgi:eukaryotic-like serine/threonine-protein kinase
MPSESEFPLIEPDLPVTVNLHEIQSPPAPAASDDDKKRLEEGDLPTGQSPARRCKRPFKEADFPKIGEAFADCLLHLELGRGLQGRVFLALQPMLAARPLVLKITRPSGQEHLALARLLHTHIVPLYFVHEDPERQLRALAMPYLGGGSLAVLLPMLATIPLERRTGADLLRILDELDRRCPVHMAGGPTRDFLGRLTYVDAVCWLGAGLADALQHAHERGLVHLDLKPGNILLAADGQPFLLDFHLARAPLSAGQPVPNWFGGTPHFMSPEQEQAADASVLGDPAPCSVDGRTDIYSLGVVLQMLLGLDRNHPENRSCSPVSVGLHDILARCVEPRLEHRYQTAGDLAADLRRHLAGELLRGVPNRSWKERWSKWRLRKPHALSGGASLLALVLSVMVLLVGTFAYWRGRQQEANRSLEEGRQLVNQKKYHAAGQAFFRGQEQAAPLPLAGDLLRALDQEGRRAQTNHLAQELHQAADELRFQVDPAGLSHHQAEELGRRCARFWALGPRLLQESSQREQLRTDLLDLALLWAHFEKVHKPSQSHSILKGAKDLLGDNPVLDREEEDRQPTAAELSGPWELYAMGRSLMLRRHDRKALVFLDQAVVLAPQSFWANFYHGVCSFRLGQAERAAVSFRVCIALEPASAPCYYNRGLAYQSLGRNQEAFSDYRQALAMDRTLAGAWLNCGVLSYQHQNLEQALDDFHRALECGADPASVHFNRALVFLARKDNPAACEALRQSLQQRPDFPGARDLLGQLRSGNARATVNHPNR